MKYSITFFILLAINITTQAQTSYNSLLWRISGNGLQKPSYLYGTMHLTDKRLFQFTDSVYNAIATTEGFAAELDMETIAGTYVKAFLQNKDEEEEEIIYVQEVVSKTFLNQHKKALEKKFKKGIALITIQDIESAESSAMYDELKKGDMPTFMDGYLFDLARRQGKWTGGIEDPEDQFNLESARDVEETILEVISEDKALKAGIENMIKIYVSENLDEIDRQSQLWKGSRDIILIKRNIKMAKRIDSLMKIRSCFFAIGAAHIPGDTGVVKLLREIGYTLTPVVSKIKIDPTKYKISGPDQRWITIPMLDSSYTIAMPGQPELISDFSGLPIQMQVYMDLGNMTGYFSMNIETGSKSPGSVDSIMMRMDDKFRSENTNYKSKKFSVNGHPAMESTYSNDYGEFLMQIIVPGNYAVVNVMYSLREELLKSEISKTFFNSFKFIRDKKEQPLIAGWQKMEWPRYAFSMQIPASMKMKLKQSDEEMWNTYEYEAIDLKLNMYLLISINEIKPAYYGLSDTSNFQLMLNNLEERSAPAKVIAERFTMDGPPGLKARLVSNGDDGEISARVMIIDRGNRRYSIVNSTENKKSSVALADSIFMSIKLLPPVNMKWQNYVDDKSTFSTFAPAPFVLNESDSTMYISFDTSTAITYHVSRDFIDPFMWYENDSSLYEVSLVSEDSLIYKKPFTANSIQGMEAVYVTDGKIYNKRRVFVNADTIYTLNAFLPEDLYKSGSYAGFYEQFRFINPSNTTNIFTNKSRALIAALSSKDSSTLERAKIYLSNAPFGKEDLPHLHEALLKKYDVQDDYYSINEKLVEIVSELEDPTTIEFIRENFTKADPSTMHDLITILSGIYTEPSYQLQKELLLKHKITKGNTNYLSYNWKADLQLAKLLYPEILQLADDTLVGGEVILLTDHLLDSGILKLSDVKPYAQKIINFISKARDQSIYDQRSYISILTHLGGSNAIALLKKIAAGTVGEIPLKAIVALHVLGQPVSPGLHEKYASFKEYRTDFYELMQEAGKLNLFPAKYKTQRSLAESDLFNQAYEDAYPDQIVFIGERKMEIDGKMKLFYLYRVLFIYDEDNKTTTLGVTGPYDPGSSKLIAKGEWTGIHDEPFELKKLDQQFRDYIEFVRKPQVIYTPPTIVK